MLLIVASAAAGVQGCAAHEPLSHSTGGNMWVCGRGAQQDLWGTTVCRTAGLGQLECWCVVVYAVTVLHVHICVLEARMNLHEGGRGCAHEALRGCTAAC